MEKTSQDQQEDPWDFERSRLRRLLSSLPPSVLLTPRSRSLYISV
jgi:hypothetical protein